MTLEKTSIPPLKKCKHGVPFDGPISCVKCYEENKNIQFNFEIEEEKDGHNNGGKTDYYDLPVGSENLQDLIEHKYMSWNIANVFKAMYRYSENHHSTKLRDLYKAKWFIEREINLQLKDKVNYYEK